MNACGNCASRSADAFSSAICPGERTGEADSSMIFWLRRCTERVRRLAAKQRADAREELEQISGVKDVKADAKAEVVTITFDARKTHAPDLHEAILQSGYKPAPLAD